MIKQIVSVWGDVALYSPSDEVVLRTAAEWLRYNNGEQLACEYCAAAGKAIGLPRKMTGEHLLQMCRSVWGGQLGLESPTPLLALLDAKAAEAPYRDHFGLWDGLWLPLAVEAGHFQTITARQRATPMVRRRADLERLLGVSHGASDDDLQEAVDRFFERQRLEKRALEIGLTVDATEDDVREREEEIRLPEIRVVNGRFPAAELDEYLRADDRRRRLLGHPGQAIPNTYLPDKCLKCRTTIHDLAVPCPNDGGVCQMYGPLAA